MSKENLPLAAMKDERYQTYTLDYEGGSLTFRLPNLWESQKISRAVGRDGTPETTAYFSMVASIRSLNGTPLIMPVSEEQWEAAFGAVDGPPLDAAAKHFMKLQKEAQEQQQQSSDDLKN